MMIRNKYDEQQMGSQLTTLIKSYLGGQLLGVVTKGGHILRGSKREKVVCPLPVGLGTDRRFTP